jgi:hypothetical protein
MESKMSQKDDPFQEEGVKKPENDNEDDDVIELTSKADITDDTDEDILELADEVDITDDADEDILELADEADIADDTDEAAGWEIEDTPDEPTDQTAIETEEGKQILELIDDIQSTLDETKGAEAEDTGDEVIQAPLPDGAEEALDKKESLEGSVFLGDDETLETEALSYSESEFVDHLGLDLTSEFSKEMFKEDSEMSVLLREKIEEAVERVIHNMLSDKDSPLVQTIIKAAKKEIE